MGLKEIGGKYFNSDIEDKTALWQLIGGDIQALEESKNMAYKERNLLVQALTKIFPSYIAKHPEEDLSWERDWMNIVYVLIPVTETVYGDEINARNGQRTKIAAKQVSWHIHDSEMYLFKHLPVMSNDWDGHSTEEKYERLKRLVPCREYKF